MNTNLLVLAAASLFLLAPVAHLQLAGVENVIVVKQEKVISDADISAAVKQAILSDMNLSKYNINVSSDKGVVTLSGKVDTVKAKLDLESKALAIVGVIKVINNVEVKS